MIGLEIILTAVFSGILYSLIWWSAKNIDPTKESQSFNWGSMVATAIIGVFVGVFAVISGSPITQMGIETQLAANAAIIAVIEKILKTLYRYLSVKFEGDLP